MSDPRKPVQRPDEAEQDRIRRIAYNHLLDATEAGARDCGMTGASFVVMGLGFWAMELAELDARATARMLTALGTIYDPAASVIKKQHAERKRRAAVDKLFAAVDLELAPAVGRG